MIISPNCFYHAFQQESDVVSSFQYDYCNVIDSYGECAASLTTTSTTSYRPPFTYSYQCSADFITYYAPVFVFVCILSTFFIPLIQVFSIKCKLPNILQFSNLFHPMDNLQVQSLVYIDEIFGSLVFLITFVGLILTYGAIFPPLAITFFITICSHTYSNQVIIGRFITNVVQLRAYAQLNMLDNNLKVQPLLSTIEKCGWVLLYVSCSFYTLILFDILGNVVGFYQAYWVLIVMPCIPVFIYVFVELYKWIHFLNSKKIDPRKDGDEIQLSSSQSLTLNPLRNEIECNRLSSIVDLDVTDRHGTSINIESLEN